MFNFFQGAGAAFKAQIIRQVNAAHATLANDPANLISPAQHLACLNRHRHIFHLDGSDNSRPQSLKDDTKRSLADGSGSDSASYRLQYWE